MQAPSLANPACALLNAQWDQNEMEGAWFDPGGGRGDYDRHMGWQGP